MGRASISIAITSNFNGSGIDAAMRKMEQLSVSAVAAHGKFGAASVKAGAELGKASHRLSSFGQSMAKVGDALTTHVTLPMGIAAAAAIKSALDIDTAWYNVRKTVDMTEDGYQRLKQGAIELSNTQPVSAETILNIEALGGQLGISNDHLESFAQTVSGLDIATNLNAEAAATQLAQFANIVQMSEDDFDNFGSALVDLGNHSATTESDIMQLALRFASAGHVAGMSNQEILGISTALSSLGMKADAGGSALSQIINKISLDVDTNGEHLEAWAQLAGKSIDEFKRAWKDDAAGTFEDVLKGVANAGDEMNAVLDSAGVTQIRNSDAMRRLASSGDLMSESIQRANTAWQQNTALSREVENRNKSLASQFDVLKNRATNTLALVGEPIAKMALQTVKGFEPMIQGIQGVALAFNQADPAVQRFAFNMGATAMAAGPVMSIVGRGIDLAGQFGIKIARASQQFGVYNEALNTTDVAMLRNLAHTDTFAARMGLTRNALTKAAGGASELKASVAGATESVRANAAITERAKIYSENLSHAMVEEGKSYEQAAKAANKVVHSKKADTQVRKAQAVAEKNMSNAIMDTTKNSERAKIYTDALTDAIENQGMSYEQAAKKANKVVNSGKAQKQVAEAQAKALKEVALSTKEGTEAYESQMRSASKASTGLTNLKNVLLGIGGIAIGAAAFAGIEYLATQTQMAFEHAERLRGATDGLREASRATTVSLDSQAQATSNVATSQASARARLDELQEAQIQLGEQIRETNTSANVQIGTLNRAWSAIDQYANKSGLSALEQYKLQQAIQTVNEVCGTQYSVVDASRGRIADSTGAIQLNTSAIKENVEAIKKQVELESIQSNLEGLYAQRLSIEQEMGKYFNEHSDALTKNNALYKEQEQVATRLKQITDSRGNALKGHEQEVTQLLFRQAEINNQIDHGVDLYREQQQTLDSINEEIDYNTDRLERASGQTSKISEDIKSWLEGSGKFSYFDKPIERLDEFAAACEDAGLKTQDFENMSRDSFEALSRDFNGSAESILQALGKTEDGREILEHLRSSMDETGAQAKKLFEQFQSSDTFTNAFDGSIEGVNHSLEDFSSKCHEAGINFESLNALGSENIQKLAKDFDGSAGSIVDSLKGMGEQGQTILNNIGSNWKSNFSDSTQGVIDTVAKMRSATDAELMALSVDLGVKGETATRMFMEGLQRDMNPESAANLAKSVFTAFQDNINPEQMSALANEVSGAFKDGLSPEQASAVASAYSGALSQGLSTGDAVTRAKDAGLRISEVIKEGMSPEQASAASAAYSSALASGLTVDQAVTKVNTAMSDISAATEGLDPSVAAAVMASFSAAVNSGVSIDTAVTQVQDGVQAIQNATANLDPGVAAAAMQAFTNALNQGVSVSQAATKVEEAITQIENATQGLDPGVAASAMEAYANAINNGVNLDDAAKKVEEGMQRIEAAAGGLDTSAGQAAMQAFADAIKNGANLDDAAQQVEEGLKQIEAAAGGLDTSAGQQAMQAFADAIKQGLSFEDAIAQAQSAIQNINSTLNGANFSSAAGNWQMQFATLGNTAHSTLQGFVPILSDDGRVLGQAPANSLDPQTYVWAQKAAEGPQAYNNALLPWGATFTGTVQSMMNQVTTPLGTTVPIFHSKGSEAAQNYGLGLSAGGTGVYGLSQTISDSAVQGLQTGVPGAGSAGTETGSNYANTIGTSESIAYAAALATQTGVIGAYQLGVFVAGVAGMATAMAYTTSLQTSGAGALGIGQTIASNAVSGLAFGATVALTTGNTTGTNYVIGFQGSGLGALGAGMAIASNAVSGLSYGTTIALTTGTTTGTNYVIGFQGAGAGALGAGMAIASNAVSGLSYGTTPALTTGTTTGSNYVIGIQGQQGAAQGAGQTLASMAVAGLDTGTGPAMTSGNTTGSNYVTGVNSQGGAARGAGRNLASNVVSGLDTGKSPARAAGSTTGSNYANGVSSQTGAASSAGHSVASSAKSAMSAFAGQAYYSGQALGLNFAAGVRAGGAAAVAAARDIASQVASILKHSTPKKGPLRDDDVWGYHFTRNITTGMKKGTPGIKMASLDLARTMSAPVKMASDTFAIAQASATKAIAAMERSPLVTNSQLRNYQAVAERVTERVVEKTVYEKAAPATTVEAVSEGPVTRDELFTIFRQATLSALERSGAAHPVVYLDGRQVSKQLVNSMDSELGRLQRSRW